MGATTQLLTAEDLWNLPDRSGHCELVKGELREIAPAGFDHGSVTGRLTIRLGQHVLDNRLGEVLAAETGFVVARDPDLVRAPDIAFVSRDRIPKGSRPTSFWSGAPDLAVETMSPSDTVLDVDEKVQEWLVAGMRLVWVLNPRQCSVKIFRSNSSVQMLKGNEMLDGEDVVPGFRISVAEIFD